MIWQTHPLYSLISPPRIAMLWIWSIKTIICITLVLLCFRYSLGSRGLGSSTSQIINGHPAPVSPHLRLHGETDCYGHNADDSLTREAEIIQSDCEQSQPTPMRYSVRIATLTAHFGAHTPVWDRAIRSHHLLTLVHDMPMHVMCSQVIQGMWNKPAFILSILLDEMVKPAEERLQWLFWVDRDTLVLDHCRHPSAFLPPADRPEVHLLTTQDWNGLNNGVFLLRVSEWSINLFSDILAFPHYRPNIKLTFNDQSAMELLLQTERYKPGVEYVPQHWFNAFPNLGGWKDFESRADTRDLEDGVARRGDFIVHFAGSGDKGAWVETWDVMLRRVGTVWKSGTALRDVAKEVKHFWTTKQAA
jgi:mannan polymerase II complex MNN10 subunit